MEIQKEKERTVEVSRCKVKNTRETEYFLKSKEKEFEGYSLIFDAWQMRTNAQSNV